MDYIALLCIRPILFSSWIILFFPGFINFGFPLDYRLIVCPEYVFLLLKEKKKQNETGMMDHF